MTLAEHPGPAQARNTRTALLVLGVVVAMIGLAYAAVPLYQLFCAATGYGGTTQRTDANLKGVIDRPMTTRFDATVASGLAWTVRPASAQSDPIGTVRTVNYRATNNSDRTVTGTAVFNVTPEQAGIYFNKIECFCFTEQTLAPGETVDMPVTFFVDPELDDNAELDTVRSITLSYTFYAARNGES